MPEREWRFYLDDMIRFPGNVLSYSAGLDQSTFVSIGLHYDATVRNLELIGGLQPISRSRYRSFIIQPLGVNLSQQETD